MSDIILGQNPDHDAQRDALHVAVAPVVARMELKPGDRVNEAGELSTHPVGIVDPFLEQPVKFGETFWLCLFPQTVTGMRHHWLHPSFPNPSFPNPSFPFTEEESTAWLKEFAKERDLNYSEMILAATHKHVDSFPLKDSAGLSTYNDGKHLHFSGSDAYGEIPTEFWDHIENLTGKPCTMRAKYFSCSC